MSKLEIYCMSLHNQNYDFNDAAAPIGASFFARLIEKALPLG